MKKNFLAIIAMLVLLLVGLTTACATQEGGDTMRGRVFSFAPPEGVSSVEGKTYSNRSIRFTGSPSSNIKSLFSEHDRLEIDLRSSTVSIDGGTLRIETPALDAGNRDVKAVYLFYMAVGDSLESLETVRGYIVYVPEQAQALHWDDDQGETFIAKDVYVFVRE